MGRAEQIIGSINDERTQVSFVDKAKNLTNAIDENASKMVAAATTSVALGTAIYAAAKIWDNPAVKEAVLTSFANPTLGYLSTNALLSAGALAAGSIVTMGGVVAIESAVALKQAASEKEQLESEESESLSPK